MSKAWGLAAARIGMARDCFHRSVECRQIVHGEHGTWAAGDCVHVEEAGQDAAVQLLRRQRAGRRRQAAQVRVGERRRRARAAASPARSQEQTVCRSGCPKTLRNSMSPIMERFFWARSGAGR